MQPSLDRLSSPKSRASFFVAHAPDLAEVRGKKDGGPVVLCLKAGWKGEVTVTVALARRAPEPLGLPSRAYGKLTNRSLKSVALAAPPSSGVTPKISSTVRSVELCV